MFAGAGAGPREPGLLARVHPARAALASRCLVAGVVVAAVTVAAVQVGTDKGQNLSSSTFSANVALVAGQNAVRTATATAAYFPVPVNQVQSTWNTTITDLAGGGRECLDAFAAHSGTTLVEAMKKLAALGPPLAAVEQGIESALPPGR